MKTKGEVDCNLTYLVLTVGVLQNVPLGTRLVSSF